MSAKLMVKPNKQLNTMLKNLTFLRDNSAKIGIIEGARGSKGQDLNLVGSVHEYGAPSKGIPPRPFLNSTIRKKQKKIQQVIENAKLRYITKENGGKKILEEVGMFAKGQVIETFETGNNGEWKALKPSTIARRKKGKEENTVENVKILIDNGDLLNSIDIEVSKKIQ